MWPRLLTVALGGWLMAAASVLGYQGAARTSDVVAGALAASLATIASTEVMRPLRWGNFAIGAWLVAAPWLLDHGTTATLNSTIVGAVMAAAASIRGRITTRFGGGWSSLWRDPHGSR